MPGTAFFTLLALISAITSVPLVAARPCMSGLEHADAQGWLVTLFVAIFPSFLAQIFYLRGVDLIGPGRAGVFVNLVPVFAAIIAVTLIYELFAPFHAVALALVIGGIWLAQRTGTADRPPPSNGPRRRDRPATRGSARNGAHRAARPAG